MKFLVTGGTGFVGINLAKELEQRKHHVTVLDDFSKGVQENLEGFNGNVIHDDIRKWNPAKLDFDAIFHQAAITDTTVYEEKLMLSVNTEAFERLLKLAVKNAVPFIYASSAAVYGNAPSPQKEGVHEKPLNIYGVSKLKCDQIAREQMKNNKSHIVGLRYFNVFGPHEQHKGKMASMVYQLWKQMKEGKQPRVYKFGEQARDQIYVKDVVEANILAFEKKRSGIFNVGSGVATSFNMIIEELNKGLGLSVDPDYFDNPYSKNYQNSTCADLTLIHKTLGYKPKWQFNRALNDYLSFLRNPQRNKDAKN